MLADEYMPETLRTAQPGSMGSLLSFVSTASGDNKSDVDVASPGLERRASPKVISLVILCACVYFACGVLLLGELPGHQDAREIALSWNHNTHFCMVVASSMHVISQLVDRLCSNQPQQNRLANIALVVAVLPLIVSTLRATKYSPLYVGCNGRIIMPLRYLSWSTTTSLLLYLLWLTTNAPFSEFRTAWAANLTMLVTGFLSTTVGGAAFWLFAASSFVSFGIVVNVGYQWYADTRDISKALSGTNSALSVVYILALGSWTTFPSIWIWAELFGSNLSASAEEMLWVVCDFAAKLVQSTALFQVSYTDLRLSRRFGDLLTPGGRTALEDESWGQELLYQWGQAESRDVSSLGYCLCTFEAFLFILASSIEAVQLRNAIGRKATALFSRTIRESSRVAWCASWSRAREEPGGDYLVPNCPVLLRADIASTFPQGVLCTYEDRVACILEDTRNTMLRETHIMQEREQSGEMHIANVSHELRTPLNGIIGLSDALLVDPEGRQDDSQLTYILQTIRNSGARLGMLVNNLLDNAALSQKELNLTFEAVHIKRCLQEVTPLLTPLLAPGVKLIADVSRTLPPVQGNHERLVRVFFNVIGNAVKFCRKGSITVTAREVDKQMHIEVTDTGPGIPPEKLGVIFNPFVQGDIPFHHKLGSTGLGLSLVKAVIESHGGTVGAQSELGVKTTIKITLPLHNGGQSDRSGISRRPSSCQIFSAAESDSNTHNDNLEVASDSAPEAFSGKHPFKTEILSVDDDPMNHMVLGNMLTPQNYSVLQAVSGEQALAILKDRYAKGGNDWLPPIILMDAMMPGMDGFQTVTAIRSLFPTADMAIMMVSAKATEDAISRGFQAGCNDYITKPVKRLDLLSRIDRELNMILSRKKSGAEPATRVSLLTRELASPLTVEEGGTAHGLIQRLTVVAMRICNYSELEELGQDRLISLLGILYTRMEQLRISSSACSISWTGNFYLVGLGHWSEGTDAVSQVDAALELATQMLQTAADIAVESKCNFSVAISVYTSQMHCDADDQGTSKIFSGRAIAKAVEFPGYPGCVSADKDVHDLAVVSALSWPFISIVEDEHGSEAVCILQEGNWAEAQMRASNKARELSGNREPTSHGSRDRVLSEAEDAVEEEQVSKMTQLLNSIGMGQYAEMLDDVSVGQLMHMSDAELATLGIGKSTHRKIIAAGASYYGMALT